MVKKRVHKSTQKWESYYNSLAKEAKLALRIGLLTVLARAVLRFCHSQAVPKVPHRCVC